MRYIFVAIFVYAAAMPAAFALPTIDPAPVSAPKSEPIAQRVKHSRSNAHRHRSDGGIHPLVGSGDY